MSRSQDAMPQSSFFAVVRCGAFFYPEKTIDVLRAYIAEGVDVNAQDQYGCTALMYAAERGSAETVRALLEAGASASLETRNDDGDTVLLCAAFLNSNVEVFKALIAAGADVNASTDFGISVLMAAAGANEDRGRTSHTALKYYAVQFNPDIRVVKALIAAGADVNAQDISGYTALMYAAGHGSADTVRALIEAGAKCDSCNDFGESALMLAVRGRPKFETVLALVDAGADVMVTDNKGNTALDYAEANERMRGTAACKALNEAYRKQKRRQRWLSFLTWR